ncbi:hypothetical protein YPPY53_3481, partial [Yersinia pestis PY-53]
MRIIIKRICDNGIIFFVSR